MQLFLKISKYKTWLSTLALIAVLVVSANTAYPQGESNTRIAEMSLGQLKKEISQTKLFRELDQAGADLEGSVCGSHRTKAKETRDALADLNSRVQNKTSGNYGQQARELKDANIRAIDDLKNCYATYLPRYALLKEKSITTYDAHASAYNGLLSSYEGISDLDAHIAALEKALEDTKEQSDFIAAVENAHRQVEVRRGGKWENVSRGHKLRAKDEIRTGPRGRVRLVFNDRDDSRNAGPTVVNMGSSSHIKISSFVTNLDIPKRDGVIDLIRGTLRAFTKGWGFKSSFHVRTGTSILGIRGTEVAVSHNPDTNTTDYHLDHGDAYVETGGQQTTLTSRTSRTFSNGILSAERPLNISDWSKILTSTGDGMAETMATANASYSETLTRSNYGLNSDRPLKSGQDYHERSKEELAEGVVTMYNQALQRYDLAALRSVTSGKIKAIIEENTKNQSLKGFLDRTMQNPKAFTVKCSLCEGNVCQVLAYVETEQHLSGQGKDVLFKVDASSPHNVGPILSIDATQETITAFRLKPVICKK